MVEESTVQCLYGRAERDPGVLIRILERFSNLNIVPRGLGAVCWPDDEHFMVMDLTDIPPTTLSLIVAKIRELFAVLDGVVTEIPHSPQK